MMKSKGTLPVVMRTAVIIGLLSCFVTSSAAKDTKYISIGTASAGGIFYPLGGGMANLINKNIPGTQAVAEVTGGSVANIRAIAESTMEIGLCTPAAIYSGYSGESPFDKKMPILGLCSMFPGYMHVFVLKKANVKSISELKGKRVAFNRPGTTDYDISTVIFEAHGVKQGDMDLRTITVADAVTAMKDEQIDACIYSMGIGASAFLDLSVSRDVVMLPIEPSAHEKIFKKYPYYYVEKIPAGTYKGTDKDVDVLASMYGAVVHKDADKKLVHDIMKSIYENKKDLEAIHKEVGQYFTPENAIKGMPIPLHPGAIEYLKEKGVTIPDQLML